jgi:nucleoside-diphosphate-sugar epimerase
MTDDAGARPLRVVVVGASGNIGTALLRRIGEGPETIEPVGVSRRFPASSPPYDGIEWHAIDIRSPTAAPELAAAFRGADAVVHLGWALQPNHDDRALWSTNVRGTREVLEAAAAAGVGHVLYASSVGAYSPGSKARRVAEDWPTGGLPSSHYARHKAINERYLDAFEARHPDIVVTRFRPGLVFQRDSASEIARLFVGPVLPTRLLGRIRLPVLPLPSRLVSQIVHADDVADAFHRAIVRRAGGAFNLAAEPPVTPPLLAAHLGARWVPIRRAVVRSLVWATWMMRLQRSDPGWLDIATSVPIMSTRRARELLGWAPTRSSPAVLREFLDALADGDGVEASPPLHPAA